MAHNCKDCDTALSEDNQTPSGIREKKRLCIECERARRRKQYHANREKYAEASLKRYHENAEDCQRKHREYYQKNQEDLRQYRRDYYRKNLERSREYSREFYRRNPEKSKGYRVMQEYGVTLEEYNKRMSRSDCCEICGSTKSLVYDHCHDTMKFRGVLCSLCNRSIGGLGDTPDSLRMALEYLERDMKDE